MATSVLLLLRALPDALEDTAGAGLIRNEGWTAQRGWACAAARSLLAVVHRKLCL